MLRHTADLGPAQLSGRHSRRGRAGPALPAAGADLAQFMVGYVMWTADRLPALARVRPAARPGRARPSHSDPVAALAGHRPPARPPALPGQPQPGSGASRANPSPPLSPRLASCCNIVMGLVMGYMLIISL